MSGGFHWTPEVEMRLRKLWVEERLSSPAIAIVLDPSGHLTRSAVFGKVSRLGLSGRSATSSGANLPADVGRPPKLRDEPKFIPIPPKPISEVLKQPQGRRILELCSNQCRFPLGNRLDHAKFFCGEPTPANSSWCATHRLEVFSMAQGRSRAI